MKTVFVFLSAAILVSAVNFNADAATAKKQTAAAKHEASCKAQAAKKYTAVHFLKRRAFVKQCMGEA